MSSSAIPHVISFLTRPLLAAFPPASVTSAQLILTASLASSASATFTLSASSTPPAPIFAASIGANIPWTAWCTALAGGSEVPILLFYGPGYLKVRIGEAPVADIWSEDAQGSIVRISQVKAKPIAPLLQQSTGARLRGALLSARMRNLRRQEAIRPPSLIFPTADSESDDPTSDSDSDSDCSTTSSKFSAYSTASHTSAASSPPASPPKAAFVALPAVYGAPNALYRAPRSTAKPPQPMATPAKTALTAYLYQGGVTRVMTGGVMLGPRHIVRCTRS